MSEHQDQPRKSTKAEKARQRVLARYRLTRNRQKAWREKPELMESIRQRATNRAKAVKEGWNQNLKNALSLLPERMTTEELNTLFLDEYCRSKDVTRSSFFMRVKRRGLMVFDHADCRWVVVRAIAP